MGKGWPFLDLMQNVFGGGVEKARVWDVVRLLAVVAVFFLEGTVGMLINFNLWLLLSQVALIETDCNVLMRKSY